MFPVDLAGPCTCLRQPGLIGTVTYGLLCRSWGDWPCGAGA